MKKSAIDGQRKCHLQMLKAQASVNGSVQRKYDVYESAQAN